MHLHGHNNIWSHFPLSPLHLTGLHWPNTLRALRHRNFRLFYIGQLISLIGTWMQSTALQWLVYRLTNSQTSLGVVDFIQYLPVLLFSLLMGVIVDRFPKRTLLMISQTWFMLLAAMLTVLTYLHVIQYWHILTFAFLFGCSQALDMPTRQAFYADMVDREDIMNAIGLNSTIINGARIIGPAVAGVVVAAVGEAPAFLINALSFLAVLAALALMRMPSPVDSKSKEKLSASDLWAGFTYVFKERRVFGLVLMIALFSLIGFPFYILLPVFARDVLHIGVQGFGQLVSCRGIGAFIGAVIIIALGERLHKGRWLIATRWLIGLAILVLAISRTPRLSMAAMVLFGYTFVNQLVLTNTLIQWIVPDRLRGRVLSFYTWALAGVLPVGSLLIGLVGDHFGAPNAALYAALGCMVLAVLNQLWFPEMAKWR